MLITARYSSPDLVSSVLITTPDFVRSVLITAPDFVRWVARNFMFSTVLDTESVVTILGQVED